MGFLRPEALAILPGLLLLLLWARARRRRRPRRQTTYLLFARAQQKMPPPPRRRTPILTELWWLLPAVLTTLATAGPYLTADELAPEVVVLVDRSASMATRLDGRNRIVRGLDRLRSELDAPLRLEGVPELTTGSVERASPRSVTDGELRMQAAVHHDAGRRVVVVTDRELSGLPDEVGIVRVGDVAPNAGIVACGLDVDGRLLVRAGATPGWSRPLTVRVTAGATGLASSTFAAKDLPIRQVFGPLDVPSDSAEVVVSLDSNDDANPLDDRVVLVRKSASVRVGFPPRGYDAIYRAFVAHPEVQVFRGDGPCALRIGPGPSARHVFVAPRIPGTSLGSPGPVRGPMIFQDAPALASREPLALPAVYPVTENHDVLARIGETPILVRDGDRIVFLQDPDSCDWPRHPSFPLVCAQCLLWLEIGSDQLWAVRSGEPGGAVLDPAATVGPFAAVTSWGAPRAAAVLDERTPLAPWLLVLAALALVAMEWIGARRATA